MINAPVVDLQKLSEQEKDALTAMLAEAEARGLRVSRKSDVQILNWPVNSDGYFIKADGKSYVPKGEQGDFVNSSARFVAFAGSRGSGKTAAGAQKALQKVKQGLSGAVLNPDFENFKTSTWPELREWIPWDLVVESQQRRKELEWEPHQPFTMVFKNKARVICKGLKNPDSARGPNINWLWYDEAGRDIDGLAWKIAVASVRIGKDPQAFITTTPRGMNWIYELFVEEDIPEEALKLFSELDTRKLVEWFEVSIFDNKDNLDPGFFASMLATYPSGYLREQEIFGKFIEPGGVLGNPAWFDGKIVPHPPEGVRARVRYWDLAATEKKISGKKRTDPDETVGTKFSWDGLKLYYIENQVCGHWEWMDIKKRIRDTAMLDGPYVKIYIEQEPAAGGKNQVAELRNYIQKELPGWIVRGHRPEGDKIMRANLWFAEAALGVIYLVAGTWVNGFLKQLSGFPSARHDDRIDSTSGARACAAPIRKWKNIPFVAVGM